MPRSPNRAADHVGLVIDLFVGAKPADIPLEQAEKFVTIVNITTTKAIGKIWCRPPFCFAPMR
jgi:hypothetical protein